MGKIKAKKNIQNESEQNKTDVLHIYITKISQKNNGKMIIFFEHASKQKMCFLLFDVHHRPKLSGDHLDFQKIA